MNEETQRREYVVLLPGREDVWEQATPEQRAATYGVHEKFARTLAERGHLVTGGAELAHSREAKVVRGGAGGTVTQGPYAETVEQLTGFYLVESSDLDDLLEICGLLADAEGGVEVRPTVAPPTEGAPS